MVLLLILCVPSHQGSERLLERPDSWLMQFMRCVHWCVYRFLFECVMTNADCICEMCMYSFYTTPRSSDLLHWTEPLLPHKSPPASACRTLPVVIHYTYCQEYFKNMSNSLLSYPCLPSPNTPLTPSLSPLCLLAPYVTTLRWQWHHQPGVILFGRVWTLRFPWKRWCNRYAGKQQVVF